MKLFTEEKLNKLLTSYYRYIAIVLCLVILLAGFFLLLWPKYQKLKTEGVIEHREIVNQLDQKRDYLIELELMKRKYEELDFRAWQTLDYILPKEENIYLLFAQMEILAKDNNLQLDSININESQVVAKSSTKQSKDKAPKTEELVEELPKEVKEVKISLNVQGLDSYEDFKQFLDNLENDVRILNINSLTYYPDKTAYTISVTTYYLASADSETGTTINLTPETGFSADDGISEE